MPKIDDVITFNESFARNSTTLNLQFVNDEYDDDEQSYDRDTEVNRNDLENEIDDNKGNCVNNSQSF